MHDTSLPANHTPRPTPTHAPFDDEPSRLAAVLGLGLLDTVHEERFDRITRTASVAFDVPIALVSLVDSKRQWFKSCIGLDLQETPRNVAFCEHAIATQGIFQVEDATVDARFASSPLVTGEPHIRFYAGRPLRTSRNQVVGTLCIIDRRPRRLSDVEMQLLDDLATWAERELETTDLQRTTDQLQDLLGAATQHAIVGTDADGRITVFNAGAELMLGWSPKDALGSDAMSLVDPGGAGSAAMRDDLLAATDSGRTTRRTLIGRGGRRVPVQITMTRQHDARGHLTGYVAIARDISELTAAEQALSDTESRFRAMVQHASDGIAVIDDSGVILYASPAAERLVGLPAAGAVGHNVIEFVHPADWGKAEGALRTTVANAGPRPRIELRLEHGDGTVVHVELVANSLLTEQAVRGIVLNIRDISVRREVDALKDELISMVSHELRTPLTSIRGALGLLAAGVVGPFPDEAQNLVAMADRNAHQLTRLIDDILDLERIQAGTVPLVRTAVSVSSALERVASSAHGLAEPHGVRVAMRLPQSDGSVLVDADRIHQVLMNLVGNAVKFSSQGQTVTVAAADAGSVWELSVSDHGRGIPANHIERVFNRFEQVDASDRRDKGGTGLGLAIAKAIVDQHGGDLTVVSEPGVLTTFTFTVPASRQDDT